MSSQCKTVRKICILAMSLAFLMQTDLFGFVLKVREPDGTTVVDSYRWLVEEDTTNWTNPGALVSNSISLDIHNSYAPVVAAGRRFTADSEPDGQVTIAVPGTKRYIVSVMPDEGHAMSGKLVDLNQTEVTVIVNPFPIPTAQITIFAFEDHNPINNAPDATERGLPHFNVSIAEIGGQQMMDAWGNMIGTTYQQNPDGSFVMVDGAPVVDEPGLGYVLTDAEGKATIKYLAPGKYGVQVIPPDGSPWVQTATIEGTKVIDAWVKANEPDRFLEGFGVGFYHCFFGYVNRNELPWVTNMPVVEGSGAPFTGSISGTVVYNHFSRPPATQGFHSGPPVGQAWVGLNDAVTGEGLFAMPCNPDTGAFQIDNLPDGIYELVTWDENLDSLFGFHTVVVPPGVSETGEAVALGDVLTFRWFGTLEGSVFNDMDEDGFPDPGEMGLQNRGVNLRFRDGTIYQASPTGPQGDYAFEEVFPFFKWLVVEVDFATMRDTGMTSVVDNGGAILPDAGWAMPSDGARNPQPQADINTNTGNNLSRTQVSTSPGEVLLQAMHLFLNQNNRIDWGKKQYSILADVDNFPYGDFPGAGDVDYPPIGQFNYDNGGIAGMVVYDTTRAENDPKWCAAEPWQPGIPLVQVALYEYDWEPTVPEPLDEPNEVTRWYIRDLNGDGGPTLADVDNYPFQWAPMYQFLDDGVTPNPEWTGSPGPEDQDRNGPGPFNPGDAIQIVTTDSWDTSKPEDSIGPDLLIHETDTVHVGFDGFGTWNQVRPGVFDGGFAITSHFPGGMASGNPETPGLPSGAEYVVEVAPPPGYDIVKEEDKNVDFGDEYVPSPQFTPAECVGDLHLVPAELTLFPGVPCVFAGERRPLADRKVVDISTFKNTGVEFFLKTDVPKAARAVGFVNNDLSAEFDTTSPVFGEKQAPKFLPISIQDWAGNELGRVYCDEWGSYNAMLPSTYTVNVPAPSGVSPQMATFVLNHPGPIPDPADSTKTIIDPHYDPSFSTTPWTLHFYPGTTTYLDTPIVPVAAFAGFPNGALDTDPPTGTPVIFSAEGPAGGPVLTAAGQVLTIKSVGNTTIPNPEYPIVPGAPATVSRDFGFGGNGPNSKVTINGVALTINTWTNDQITATADFGTTTTGTLVVTRDNGLSSDLNLTVHIAPTATVRHVSSGTAHAIQDAIDAASAGDLIVVHPGTYNENVILYKPVTIQGSGAPSTVIQGNPQPAERLTYWHNKIVDLLTTDPFAANECPGIMVLGNVPGNTFAMGSSGVIDGLQTTGSLSGGGIYVNSLAHYLEIRHCKVQGNQGSWGGGITIGTPQGTDLNTNINIHHNYINKNGGIQGPGGVAVYTGATNYRIWRNRIMGNFSRNSGGGIGHLGLSDNGLIEGNIIVSNEVFFGQLVPGGGDGGGIFVGTPPPSTVGSGNVTINANLIQGNLAGAGNGGGICALIVSGDDVTASPANPAAWYELNIFNNMVVNNVAGYAAGGISLQNAAKVRIINNTVANNDSTATSALAFPPGSMLLSNPQGAGIVSFAHTLALHNAFDPSVVQEFSNPVLHDNIIWHNNSWRWNVTAGTGALEPNPAGQYQDLTVSGVAGMLNPQYCVLSAVGTYAATNTASPAAFVNEYTNTLWTAAVLDEGGNAITTRIREIGLHGDYHIMALSGAFENGGGLYVSATAALQSDYDGDSRMYVTSPEIGADQLVISNEFVTGPEGFTYVDDPFFGTNQPNYASGNWQNGIHALTVQVGNVNNSAIGDDTAPIDLAQGMSGGWQKTLTTRYDATWTLDLEYWFAMQSAYDTGEYSQVLVSVDGGAPIEVYREDGVDGGGPTVPTGWVTETVNLGSLASGEHTITIGLYNNHKNANNEFTQLRIGSVRFAPTP